MTFGTWAALIPSFQQKFGLSEAQLSWVLLGLVVGALISMPLTGQVIAARGSRTIAFGAALAFCAALCLLALAPNYAALIALALVFGALKGAVDVSINAQANNGGKCHRAGGHVFLPSFLEPWRIDRGLLPQHRYESRIATLGASVIRPSLKIS
jgi:MFS family permease